MAVKERHSTLLFHRRGTRPLEILGEKAYVSVHLAITLNWKYCLADKRRLPLSAVGRIPQGEHQILLSVAANEMTL